MAGRRLLITRAHGAGKIHIMEDSGLGRGGAEHKSSVMAQKDGVLLQDPFALNEYAV